MQNTSRIELGKKSQLKELFDTNISNTKFNTTILHANTINWFYVT